MLRIGFQQLEIAISQFLYWPGETAVAVPEPG